MGHGWIDHKALDKRLINGNKLASTRLLRGTWVHKRYNANAAGASLTNASDTGTSTATVTIETARMQCNHSLQCK